MPTIRNDRPKSYPVSATIYQAENGTGRGNIPTYATPFTANCAMSTIRTHGQFGETGYVNPETLILRFRPGMTARTVMALGMKSQIITGLSRIDIDGKRYRVLKVEEDRDDHTGRIVVVNVYVRPDDYPETSYATTFPAIVSGTRTGDPQGVDHTLTEVPRETVLGQTTGVM